MRRDLRLEGANLVVARFLAAVLGGPASFRRSGRSRRDGVRSPGAKGEVPSRP